MNQTIIIVILSILCILAVVLWMINLLKNKSLIRRNDLLGQKVENRYLWIKQLVSELDNVSVGIFTQSGKYISVMECEKGNGIIQSLHEKSVGSYRQALNGKRVQTEFRIGSETFLCKISPISIGRKVELGMVVWINITNRKNEELKLKDINDKLRYFNIELKDLAETDPLTRIYNREKFNRSLEQEIQRAGRYDTPLSVILFDIDHFKSINDRFGHDVGDQVLIQLSDLVRKTIRETEVFARWGGEEFVVIATETDLQGAQSLAERIRQLVEFSDFTKTGRVTCSFGVAQFTPQSGKEELMKAADVALYQAKESGRNRVITAG